MFTIICTEDKIWNQIEFIKYLLKNQYKKIELGIVPEAMCLTELGVYEILDLFEFEQVDIYTWNPLEQHERYTIKFAGSTFWFNNNNHGILLPKLVDIDPNLQTWNMDKIFMCFYHRPIASRLALAGHMNTYYDSQSIIHFSIDTDVDSLIDFEFDKLLSYDVDSVSPAANLLKFLPILQSSRETHTKYNGYDYSDPLTALYQRILVDIVGETHVAGKTFFPTEKTTRPMLLKKPFITFASRHYMAYLRQMGFQTFGEFWDEEYDGFETKHRLMRIYKVVNEIASYPPAKLAEMYQRMQPILDHNHDLLISQSYNKTITKIS